MKTRHPLHPTLAHFPIALWTASLACDAAALGLEEVLWWKMGFWSLLIGFILAVPTLFTGFLEARTLASDHPAASTVTAHMGIMTTAGMLFFLSVLARGGLEPPTGTALMIALGSSAFGFVLLVVGGWLAADMVYGQGVGARRPTPEAD